MTITLDKLADTLQTLFTTEADQAAKESGMIQRRRKISGAGFVQTPGQELGAEIGIPALTASLGVADSCPGDDWDSLISRADYWCQLFFRRKKS